MNPVQVILFKSFVKPFYRQNAGFLAFLLFIMFAAVGRANEVGLLEYHYSLIKGMFLNPVIFIIVLLVWWLYARKCAQFVVDTMGGGEFSYLNMFRLISGVRAFFLLLAVQILLFLPVLSYVAIIVGVGLHQHWRIQVLLVLAYNLFLSVACAGWYLYMFQNPGRIPFFARWRLGSFHLEKFYWSFGMRYLLTEKKLLLLATKLYSCGILYLMVGYQTPAEYDLRMIFLFYSFGIFGHGVLIHQTRGMEETYMSFYRCLPQSIFGRWLQYACLYFLLFVPEIAVIDWLTPGILTYGDAFLFILFGYSLLLLLHSILYIRFFRILDYLKILSGIFFIIFIGVLTGMMFWLSAFALILSIYLFGTRFYQFER